MNRFRKVAFFLLVIYVSLTLAISLHYHPQGTDGTGVHCKLCQVSQICLEEAGTPPVTYVLLAAPFLETEQVTVFAVRLSATVPRRAPPIA